MSEEYEIQRLNEKIAVCTGEAHSFGTDAFLLAAFSSPKRDWIACDLGTGCGIIPMIWKKEGLLGECYGVDIQPSAIRQFEEALRICEGVERVYPLLADLKELPKDRLPMGKFHLVTCNPPYQTPDSGKKPESAAGEIARRETLCTMEDVCAAADSLLRFGGRFCVCQRPERLADVICGMRKCHIEPKRLRFVQRDVSASPWLVLVEGRKGGKPGLHAERPFCVYEGGVYTSEMRAVYGKAFHGEEKEGAFPRAGKREGSERKRRNIL